MGYSKQELEVQNPGRGEERILISKDACYMRRKANGDRPKVPA
jgi:hypothetical protein